MAVTKLLASPALRGSAMQISAANKRAYDFETVSRSLGAQTPTAGLFLL